MSILKILILFLSASVLRIFLIEYGETKILTRLEGLSVRGFIVPLGSRVTRR